MTDRAYTVAELDALRQAVERKYTTGSYLSRHGISAVHREIDREVAVAQRVMLHMLAGHTADDLIRSEVLADREAALSASALRLERGLRIGEDIQTNATDRDIFNV